MEITSEQARIETLNLMNEMMKKHGITREEALYRIATALRYRKEPPKEDYSQKKPNSNIETESDLSIEIKSQNKTKEKSKNTIPQDVLDNLPIGWKEEEVWLVDQTLLEQLEERSEQDPRYESQMIKTYQILKKNIL